MLSEVRVLNHKAEYKVFLTSFFLSFRFIKNTDAFYQGKKKR